MAGQSVHCFSSLRKQRQRYYVVHRRLCFLTSTIPETLMWCGGSLFLRVSYLVNFVSVVLILIVPTNFLSDFSALDGHFTPFLCAVKGA